MARPKGSQKTPGSGRKKGTPNRISVQVKDMVIAALESVGGKRYLEGQAHKNPVAFMALVAKVIPLQVSGEMDNRITIKVINFAEAGDDA